jgi:acetyl/propionyl-CoA carboxylase alpha subunit
VSEANQSEVKFPQRIAVVNRGEAAVRLIRAVRELNAEYGCGIKTVALHTEAERRAMFVRQADEAVTLRSTSWGIAYLDHSALERALQQSRADAVWVGWGFVAEDIAFAELCARLNLTFIGPPPAAMRTLGDKVEAKLLAEKVGVPLAPWSGGPVETREDARRHAEAIGYPLIIKARSGGGGRGIRKVFSPDELEVALERTREAERSFGDPVVFLERLVTDARHVEVQIIADNYGNVWAPGVRDWSIQRRNQKVIEESSSPLLTKEQADHLRSVSAELVRAAGYRGAGTVEFLYQPDQKVFTFLEVNHSSTSSPLTPSATSWSAPFTADRRQMSEDPPGFMPAARSWRSSGATRPFSRAFGTFAVARVRVGTTPSHSGLVSSAWPAS